MTTMRIMIFQMLFVLAASNRYGQHVYVEQVANWYKAQSYCRENHYDLSSFSSAEEEDKVKNEAAGNVIGEFWIGLYRNNSSWQWSGGESTNYTLWAKGEPNDGLNVAARACWSCNWNGWRDMNLKKEFPFMCLSFKSIELRMPWEQALAHCMEGGTRLLSLTSETEHRKATLQIQHHHNNRLFWIGLRFLADRWLWVDGKPLIYEAWGPNDQDDRCPVLNRCGALTPKGVWEKRDCAEELPFLC